MAVSTIKTDYVPYTRLNNCISYWRRNGVVGVKISTNNTILNNNGVLIGTLPEGFRPPWQCDFAGTALGGSAVVFFRVESDGTIKGYASQSTVYWSGTFSFAPI